MSNQKETDVYKDYSVALQEAIMKTVEEKQQEFIDETWGGLCPEDVAVKMIDVTADVLVESMFTCIIFVASWYNDINIVKVFLNDIMDHYHQNIETNFEENREAFIESLEKAVKEEPKTVH